MNKLSPEHIHLLLDEPIYVLESDLRENFEGHEEAPDQQPIVEYKGENKKGILIMMQESLLAEDEVFIFKGLNALDIFTEDVALLIMPPEADKLPAITHSKRLVFGAEPTKEISYQVETIEGIAHLECHSIKQIRNNEDLKRSFWLGLKAIIKA